MWFLMFYSFTPSDQHVREVCLLLGAVQGVDIDLL